MSLYTRFQELEKPWLEVSNTIRIWIVTVDVYSKDIKEIATERRKTEMNQAIRYFSRTLRVHNARENTPLGCDSIIGYDGFALTYDLTTVALKQAYLEIGANVRAPGFVFQSFTLLLIFHLEWHTISTVHENTPCVHSTHISRKAPNLTRLDLSPLLHVL